MSDPTRKTGAQTAIPEDDAIPDEIDPMAEQSVGTRAYYIERDIRDINRRLKEGDRQLANLRTADENQREMIRQLEHAMDVADSRIQRDLEGRVQAVEAKILTAKTEVEGKISLQTSTVTANFETLRDTVNPRISIWKVLGYIVVLVVPTAVAIIGWIWTAAKYPDRSEYEKLKEKIEKVNSSEVEVRTKIGLPPAQN